ncbi:YpjP family protein [Amphibacillus jilinensis]|uniref:YpjP family protein n=1 Tax=Amphibacillus jilinensis TaxID=1216008 RepID=UPI0002F01B2B|nr:YpjP family protein [Amphibacillus jilinensis]
MKLWLKKIFVATVAVMTLGIYVPPLDIDTNAEVNHKEIESPKKQPSIADAQLYDSPTFSDEEQATQLVVLDPKDVLVSDAKERTLEKLGPRILKQVNQEVTEEIIPNLEYVMNMMIDCEDRQDAFTLSLIEHQTPGYGEKIFDLYDDEIDQIVAKFHVRREHRPQEGYWFNFHYHLAADDYEVHHPIGEVFWSKNTPPKWMS